MQTVACISLQEGMILGTDVLSHRGDVIAKKGDEVNLKLISKFKRYNVMVVDVLDAMDLANTYFERVQVSPGFKKFMNSYQEAYATYKEIIMNLITKHYTINFPALLSLYDSVRKTIRTDEDLIDYMYNQMVAEDEITHAHCFKSALLAGTFADWCQFTNAEKLILIQAAFVYDIGKLLLPNELLWKTGIYTPEEKLEIQRHTTLGYDMLMQSAAPYDVCMAVLSHHERVDGSGYPNHLKREDISKYAKILAIIDTYEALSAARTYRSAKLPLEIISTLQEDGMVKYDIVYLLPIMQHLSNMLVGRKVLLSNGKEMIIRYINNNNLSKPILEDNEHHLFDLSRMTDTKIVTML